ncbi:hypothetical protein M6B38_171230 [Iris pallida]|uniref:Uncharacterized protein n=1 Tax=Iris pallida TaxID=29817 RepID=A0AAX6EUP6_IRIPA|nr:hypothetical protein M6B38_171230 [Iris pallida]
MTPATAALRNSGGGGLVRIRATEMNLGVELRRDLVMYHHNGVFDSC